MYTKPTFVHPIASPAAAVTAAYSAQQLAALYASAGIPPPGGHGGAGGGDRHSPQQIPGALSAAATMQQAPGVFGREGEREKHYRSLLHPTGSCIEILSPLFCLGTIL